MLDIHGEKSNENVEPGEKSSMAYASDDKDINTYDFDQVEEIADALEEVVLKYLRGW